MRRMLVTGRVLSLLVGLVVLALLPQGCGTPQLCAEGQEVATISINPTSSPCKVKCDCNNLLYEGECVDGKCVAKQREECATKGASRSCRLAAYVKEAKNCPTGEQTCQPEPLTSQLWGDCKPFNVENDEKGAQLCINGRDDDCDGKIDRFDEDCQNFCRPNDKEPCYTGPTQTRNIGECKLGVRTCGQDGRWGACEGDVKPKDKETCNGLDDDCNGRIDDLVGGCKCAKAGDTEPCYGGPSDSKNKGICKLGVRSCSAELLWGRCEGQVLPRQEECNKEDDDCNGQVDDGINCSCGTPGQRESCYTGPEATLNQGVCVGGVRVCTPQGQWGPCIGQVLPAVGETCDGKDNNCDGSVDEGCASRPCEKDADCPTDFACRGQRCVSRDVCDPPCTGLKRCVQRACICPEKWSDCSGICYDTRTSALHCGQCGTACKPGESCVDGACKLLCPTGQSPCNGQCVDLQRNLANCGACGTSCELGQFCFQGQCQCPPGQDLCNKVCVDLQTNLTNCGACGTACASGERCEKGVCSSCGIGTKKCGTGCCSGSQTCCSSACVDTQTDKNNCGACGTACAAGELCCGGSCVKFLEDKNNCGACGRACPTSLACCAGNCIDTQKDNSHCGTCGTACAVGQQCCSGACPNVLTDVNNCGGCGVKCAAGKTCASGQCVCPAGQTDCGGTCVTLSSDANHCGACNNKCATGTSCCSGRCAALDSDANNCGSCGFVCLFRSTCGASRCQKGCATDADCPNSGDKCRGGVCQTIAKASSAGSAVNVVAVSKSFGGSYVVVGHYRGSVTFGSTTLTSKGADDVFIVSRNFSGNVNWALSVGGTGGDIVADVLVDFSGEVYVVGSFTGSMTAGSKVLQSTNGFNTYIIKIDSQGSIAWAQQTTTSASGNALAESITRISFGAYAIVGTYNITAQYTDGSKTAVFTPGGTGVYNTFVMRIDSNGALSWGVTISGNTAIQAKKIFVDQSSRMFVAGSFLGSFQVGNTTLTSAGKRDIFVSALDPSNGTVRWIASAGGAEDDFAYSMAADNAGSAFVVGTVGPSPTFGTRTLSTTKAKESFVAKLSNAGAFLWALALRSGPKGSEIRSIVCHEPYLYVGGSMFDNLQFAGKTFTSKGSSDAFLLSLDGQGKELWGLQFGGTGTQTIGRSLTTVDAQVVFVANFSGTIDVDGTQLTSQNNDFFVFATYVPGFQSQ